MFKIKDLVIEGKVVLAPMAGFSNLTFRSFMKPFGVALAYTEMVSDMGLIYNNSTTYKYLETNEQDTPLAIQIFGASKESLLQAINIIENGGYQYDLIDLNLGCPVPKVTKTGAGSSWLKRPEELFDAARAIVKKSKKPVTAKIRLGWDEESINYHEIIQGLEQAGISMIALHLRTRSQIYAGQVDYELARGLGKAMSVPLVISGDIFSLEQAIEAVEITGAAGVMVARGGIGNPWLVKQIDHYYKTGEKLPNATLSEQIKYMRHYSKMLIEERGEENAVRMLHCVLPKFLNNYPHMKSHKHALVSKTATYSDIEEILQQIELEQLNN